MKDILGVPPPLSPSTSDNEDPDDWRDPSGSVACVGLEAALKMFSHLEKNKISSEIHEPPENYQHMIHEFLPALDTGPLILSVEMEKENQTRGATFAD